MRGMFLRQMGFFNFDAFNLRFNEQKQEEKGIGYLGSPRISHLAKPFVPTLTDLWT